MAILIISSNFNLRLVQEPILHLKVPSTLLWQTNTVQQIPNNNSMVGALGQYMELPQGFLFM